LSSLPRPPDLSGRPDCRYSGQGQSSPFAIATGESAQTDREKVCFIIQIFPQSITTKSVFL
ncbi:MAG TPA: hypothetical protein PLL90_10010, partial [Bacteroidales bacterium]|nr:hypothetical protein [Bacteroidales bacterium]